MKAEDFGLTNEEAETVQDFVPSLNLGQIEIGKSVDLEINENETREVEFTPEGEETPKKVRVINCIDLLTGLEVAVWLNSKSLQREFYKIAKKYDGQIKGKVIKVAVREYEHEKYGKTRAYTVQEKTGTDPKDFGLEE